MRLKRQFGPSETGVGPRDVPKGGRGAPIGVSGGPRGAPKAHGGQNHVGGVRNSRESKKSRQDIQGPLTSLTARVLLTS